MTVFISYSHKNEKALKELRRFIGPLETQGKIQFWDDGKIQPGMDWKPEIDRARDGACAAVALVCQDFLNSDFIQQHEIPYLLNSHEEGKFKLFPVFTDVTNVKTALPALAAIEGYGSPDKPLSKMSRTEREEAYRDLSEQLARFFDETPATPVSKGRNVSTSPDRDERIFHLNVALRVENGQLHCAYALPGNDPFLRAPQRPWATWSGEIAKVNAILDSGDARRINALIDGAVDHCGVKLYELMFGLPEAQQTSLFRQTFRQPADAQTTPIRAPLRVRIATEHPELINLPWRLTAWNGQLLARQGWEFLPGPDPDPRDDLSSSAPSEVLLLVPDTEHRERLKQTLQAIWPSHTQHAGHLRWASSKQELEQVLAGQSPHLVYVHAPVEPSGGEACVHLSDGCLPLRELEKRLARSQPGPAVVVLNTNAPAGLDLTVFDGRSPLLVRRRLPRLPDDPCALPCAWLHAWLREGQDPAAALHTIAQKAEAGLEAECHTAIVVANYRQWRIDRPGSDVRERLASLHLDRVKQKGMTDLWLRDLLNSASLRVMAMVPFGDKGNRMTDLHRQLLDHARDSMLGTARIRQQVLQFPPSRGNLSADLEHELCSQLGLNQANGETVRALLRRHAPPAEAGIKPVLWLHWGVFGESQAEAPLKPDELKDWLEFCAGFVSFNCPETIRMVCTLTIETGRESHPRLELYLNEQHDRLTEGAFWLRIPEAVDVVKANELMDYLKDSASRCPQALRREVGDLLMRATRGIFDELVKYLEPAEVSGDWYGLRNTLKTQFGPVNADDNQAF